MHLCFHRTFGKEILYIQEVYLNDAAHDIVKAISLHPSQVAMLSVIYKERASFLCMISPALAQSSIYQSFSTLEQPVTQSQCPLQTYIPPSECAQTEIILYQAFKQRLASCYHLTSIFAFCMTLTRLDCSCSTVASGT
jgi:hypothetical protein